MDDSMKTSLTTLLALASLAAVGYAQQPTVAETDTPPAPAEANAAPTVSEPVIPKPYEANRYDSTWEKNPFLLRTVVQKGPVTSWAQDWALAGMYSYGGKVRVSIVNKQTGEQKNLSNEGKPDPEFHLIKANFNRNRSEASAEIDKGGSDPQIIKYDENLTSKPITVNNTQHVPAAGNNAPGVPPGTVRPGAPGTVPVRTGTVPVNRPGVPGNTPGIGGVNGAVNGNPNLNTGSGPVPINAAPPTVSRRRQLIPGTPAQPQP